MSLVKSFPVLSTLCHKWSAHILCCQVDIQYALLRADFQLLSSLWLLWLQKKCIALTVLTCIERESLQFTGVEKFHTNHDQSINCRISHILSATGTILKKPLDIVWHCVHVLRLWRSVHFVVCPISGSTIHASAKLIQFVRACKSPVWKPIHVNACVSSHAWCLRLESTCPPCMACDIQDDPLGNFNFNCVNQFKEEAVAILVTSCSNVRIILDNTRRRET